MTELVSDAPDARVIHPRMSIFDVNALNRLVGQRSTMTSFSRDPHDDVGGSGPKVKVSTTALFKSTSLLKSHAILEKVKRCKKKHSAVSSLVSCTGLKSRPRPGPQI